MQKWKLGVYSPVLKTWSYILLCGLRKGGLQRLHIAMRAIPRLSLIFTEHQCPHHVYYLFVRCWQPAYGAARQQHELRPSPVTFSLYGPDLNLIICTGQVSFNEVCGESPVSKSVHIVLSEGSERREWYVMFYFYFLVLFHLLAIQLWFLNSYKQWDSNTKSNCF